MKPTESEVPDFSSASEQVKAECIKQFSEATGLYALQLFVAFGLKDGIYYTVKNDLTGEEFDFSFKKKNTEQSRIVLTPEELREHALDFGSWAIDRYEITSKGFKSLDTGLTHSPENAYKIYLNQLK